MDRVQSCKKRCNRGESLVPPASGEHGSSRRTAFALVPAALAWMCLAAGGCGGSGAPSGQPEARPGGGARVEATAEPAAPSAPLPSPRVREPSPEPIRSAAVIQIEADVEQPEAAEPPRQPGQRTLADLLRDVPDSAAMWVPDLPRMEVDEARAAAAGIGKVSGSRLVLFTDVPIDAEIEALPAAFEQAFPQWCRYFGVEEKEHADWQMTGFLMQDKSLFEKLGLLPKELPPFQHGFARNFDFWLYEQPSVYYRRHLALHEGTHGFMNTVLGSCGPPWYMEGVAELLSTHSWKNGKLALGYMPKSRDEVPMWGRIKIVHDDYAAQRAQQLARVLAYRPQEYSATEPYAWCWAAAALLDRHPRYQARFRQMPDWVLDPHFTDRFRKLIGRDWQDLAEEWQVFVAGLEYGHDVPSAAIVFGAGKPLPAEGAKVTINAARGWQSSGLRLEAGSAYHISAAGRYQVADQPQIWWCEPGGVSIRYYQGRPLGMLLAAVRAEPPPEEGMSALIRPIAVGLETTFTPDQSGTLYLRINDSAAELADNAGRLTVEIDRRAVRD